MNPIQVPNDGGEKINIPDIPMIIPIHGRDTGGVDNISVVVRHSLVQLLAPDEKRVRVSAVNSLFIGTSNELGGFGSGLMAYLFGTAIGNSNATGAIVSVVSGGVGTILVVLIVAWIWPQVRRYGKLA
jgi:hypothetical protein